MANTQLPTTVLESRLEKVSEVASRDLKKEWKESMDKPILAAEERFSRLKAGKEMVTICPWVPPESSTKLHGRLTAIAPNYTPQVCVKSNLNKVPELVQWQNIHTVSTPYSLSIQCPAACCGEFRTPLEHRALAMQRQPTPRRDHQRPGHFISRIDTLKKNGTDEDALTDLTDMPSRVNDEAKESKRRYADRDKHINAQLSLRGFEAKKVRGIVSCYHCGKRRCIYAQTKDDWDGASLAVQQKLESVGHRYSRGELLFGDGPMSLVGGVCF